MPEKTKKKEKDEAKDKLVDYSAEKAIQLFLLLGKRIKWNISRDKETGIAVLPDPTDVRSIRGVTKKELSPLGFVRLTPALEKEANKALKILEKVWQETMLDTVNQFRNEANASDTTRINVEKTCTKQKVLIDKMSKEFHEDLALANEAREEVYAHALREGKELGAEEHHEDSYQNGLMEGRGEIGLEYFPEEVSSLLYRHIMDYCSYRCPNNRKAPHVIFSMCGTCTIPDAVAIITALNDEVYWNAFKDEHNMD